MDEQEKAQRLAFVSESAELVAEARELVDGRTATFHRAISEAVEAGVRPAEVARVAGVSKARVSQIAPKNPGARARVHAQKKGSDASCVTTPDTPEVVVPHLPAVAHALSGMASTRQRRPYGRRTLFHDTRNGSDLATILRRAHQAGAERVYLTGPAPMDYSTGATHAEATRAWAFTDPGEGWAPSSRGHYLEDPDLPTLRFRHRDGGHQVAIMRAASWWGETDADEATCEAAWVGLGRLLDAVPAFAGAGLADTPSTTGKALWLRTIPEGKSYPTLSDELRELISSTAGQGRIERLPQGSSPLDADPADFTVMDGRFMYAALTWGMPVGEPTLHREGTYDERTLRGRGRWRITATVPPDWRHVGLLMAPDSAGGWRYPSRPGETFTTWADGSEVWMARSYGWDVEIHEGMTWAEGKPLDTWRKYLVEAWEKCQAAESPAAALSGKAIRSILLYAIGAFAQRQHPITRYAPIGTEPDLPPGTEVRMVGDHLMWTEQPSRSAWSLETSHPEWSATVWARARTRITEAAMTVRPGRIVGFATDALYLAGGAPSWEDDGKPGRFRVKGVRPGPFTWPATAAELYQLRDEADQLTI